MTITVTFGELFPKLKNHPNWDEIKGLVYTLTGRGTFNMAGVGNCGIQLISNVSSGCFIHRFPKIPDHLKSLFYNSFGVEKPIDGAVWYGLPDSYLSGTIDETFKDIARQIQAKGFNMYILTDGVNKFYRGMRPQPVNTTSFANYLIQNKIGYVTASPLAVNCVHKVPNDFSLVQTWVWIPPDALAFKPQKYLGRGKIKTRDELVATLMEGSFANKTKEQTEAAVDSWKGDTA